MFLSNSCQGHSTIEYLLAFIGIFYVAVTAFQILVRIIEGVNLYLFARLCPPNLKKYGPWAVVTGATDGIGKSYAHQLAQRGINIILISRNIDKLLLTSHELQYEYGVKVDVLQADFSEGWKLYKAIQEKLKYRDIGILVNNVGTIEEIRSRFISCKKNSFLKMMNVNIDSVLIMTNIVLPQMTRRKKGAVVTVSSISSQFVCPFFACYGATKAAISVLSRSLHYEYRSSGIIFQTLIPSLVKTKMIPSFNRPMLNRLLSLLPDVDVYCESAIGTLGSSQQTTGYWLHNLHYVIVLLPKSVQRIIMYFLYTSVKDV